MNVLAVARNDFLDARRSKLVWGVCSLYALFAALQFYAGSTGANPRADLMLFFMSGIAAFVLPLIALVAAYLSVAGERESGTIRIRLGLPTSRFEMTAAKFLSRGAIVLLAVALAMAVATVLGLALYEEPGLDKFPLFGVLLGLFALSYVAIAVGISAATGSRSRAMGASVGYFFVFNVLWLTGQFSVAGALRFVLEDTLDLGLHQHFYQFILQLSPATAYLNSLYLVFDPANYEELPDPGTTEWFLSPEFNAAILVAWVVVPLALGYWRFRRADLG